MDESIGGKGIETTEDHGVIDDQGPALGMAMLLAFIAFQNIGDLVQNMYGGPEEKQRHQELESPDGAGDNEHWNA